MVCGKPDLDPQTDTFELDDVLARWQKEASVHIPSEVFASYTGRSVRLFRCRTCRFGIFLPVVVGTDVFYGAITSSEDGYYVADRWEFGTALREIVDTCAERLLDVGCGSGHFLDLAATELANCDRVGIDFNEGAVAAALERGHDARLASQVELLQQVRGETFDAITCFQVVEHVADPMKLLRNLMSLLSPTGRLIVTVPNAAGPLRHFNAALTDIPPHHVTRWEPATLRAAADELGWSLRKLAREPLPHYLWDSYLPVMCGKALWPGPNRAAQRLVPLATRAMRRFGVRRLWGVPGLALYASMHRPTG